MKQYDVIIIGAGPGGIFCADELKKKNPACRILMVEKGRSIEKRVCPKRRTGRCVGCNPCSITTGFAGAGAFSDGKLSLSADVGGNLQDIVGYEEATRLIHESDEIYLSFGADSRVYGVDKEKEIREIRARAIRANLKLVECPIRHLGTEEGYKIYAKIQRHLEEAGVELLFETAVAEILTESVNNMKSPAAGGHSGAETGAAVPESRAAASDQRQTAQSASARREAASAQYQTAQSAPGQSEAPSVHSGASRVCGVRTADGRSFYAPCVVAAVGRDGADWLSGECGRIGLRSTPGTVDIGVRVEVRDEIMQFLNENLYEAKLIYHTPTFDDKVRTFCTNPSGEVATEYYDDNLAVVNGHAYKGDAYKTNNTNFALLVSKNFTEPFRTPIEYGKKIAQLSNMLCGNRIIVQTLGDFKRGRRSTKERMCRNNLIPTLKDAVPGDLSLVFPHRIMVDLEEMLEALDKVTPGIASDETLLYGVEVKFYSNRVTVDAQFETSVRGLYAIGDGAGVTRGLQQASANGLLAARAILRRQQ